MSDQNNFKELEKEQEELYDKNVDKVKNSLDANMGSIQLFTDLIELYFSKVLSYFVKASGGTPKEPEAEE